LTFLKPNVDNQIIDFFVGSKANRRVSPLGVDEIKMVSSKEQNSMTETSNLYEIQSSKMRDFSILTSGSDINGLKKKTEEKRFKDN